MLGSKRPFNLVFFFFSFKILAYFLCKEKKILSLTFILLTFNRNTLRVRLDTAYLYRN